MGMFRGAATAAARVLLLCGLSALAARFHRNMPHDVTADFYLHDWGDYRDLTHKRPAWVEVELTTAGKRKGSDLKLQPFRDKSVWVPFCRGVAVSGVKLEWPFMIAACMTIHRVQEAGFERVNQPCGFFTGLRPGTGIHSLFLVLPDDVLQDRDGAREMMKEAFQPHECPLRYAKENTGDCHGRCMGEKSSVRHSMGRTEGVRHPRRLA